MPRTIVFCASCTKQIMETKKGEAKVIPTRCWNPERGTFIHRIFLHQDCYDRDNKEARSKNAKT